MRTSPANPKRGTSTDTINISPMLADQVKPKTVLEPGISNWNWDALLTQFGGMFSIPLTMAVSVVRAVLVIARPAVNISVLVRLMFHTSFMQRFLVTTFPMAAGQVAVGKGIDVGVGVVVGV